MMTTMMIMMRWSQLWKHFLREDVRIGDGSGDDDVNNDMDNYAYWLGWRKNIILRLKRHGKKTVELGVLNPRTVGQTDKPA